MNSIPLLGNGGIIDLTALPTKRLDQADIDGNAIEEDLLFEIFIILVQENLTVLHGAESKCPDAQCSQEARVGGGRKDLGRKFLSHCSEGATEDGVPGIYCGIGACQCMLHHIVCGIATLITEEVPTEHVAIVRISRALLAPSC